MSENSNTAIRELGAALRTWRLAQGLSLRALAHQVGLSGHGTLIDYEHGRRIPPRDLLVACERVLNVPDGELLKLRAAALSERADRHAAVLLEDPSDRAPTTAASSAENSAVISSDVVVARADMPEDTTENGSQRRWRITSPSTIALSALVLTAVASVIAALLSPTGQGSAGAANTRTSPPARTVRIGFERQGQRLAVFWGSQVAKAEVTSALARDGRCSFMVTISGASASKGYSAIGTTHGLTELHPGMAVTVWVWAPGAQHGGVRFFAMNSASKPVWAPENPDTEIPLPIHPGWTPLTWTVPPVDHLHAIGMQFYAESDAPMSIAIDSITW
ncbi:helix-turn-helix domain-containing protein [Nonomuraea sp. CA-141351]|uniref:helix-turn-helix domain-containing protein n=1 Tax=Nonomuraea sp. CA-141351 TaxID=3239996 RepID=UPI003D8E4679